MNLIIVENENHYQSFLNWWKVYKEDIVCGQSKLGDRNTIYYYKHNDENGNLVWEIFNYGTMCHETCEGSLAGLCNSKDGNFPFAN